MSIRTSFNPMGTLGGGLLPPGYKRVKCIVFTNDGPESGQYINTGRAPDEQTKWELDVVFLDSENVMYNGEYNGYRFHMHYNPPTQEARIGVMEAPNHLTAPVAIGQRVEMCIDSPNGVCRIGGAEKAFTPGHSSAALYIGKRNAPGYYYSNEKVYRSRIWQAGALVQDLAPALDADGEPCFYDLAGTGDVEARTYRNLGIGELGYEQ